MRGYRHGKSCIGSCIATVTVLLLSVSMATQNWLHGDLYRMSNHADFDAGNKTFGLFTGCEYKRYGQFVNYKKRCYNSFSELSSLGHGIPVYITVSCICASGICLLLIIYYGIYCELVKSVDQRYIVHIPFILNITAFVLNLIGVASYVYLYQVKLKHNMLHVDETQDGFSSRSTLKYSFWLSACSCIAILLNIIYMWKVHVISHRRLAQRNNNADNAENYTISRNDKTRMSMIY